MTPSAYAVAAAQRRHVSVKIRSLSDAAGLQRSLRAAGVPAVVSYVPATQMGCAPPGGGDGVTSARAPEAGVSSSGGSGKTEVHRSGRASGGARAEPSTETRGALGAEPSTETRGALGAGPSTETRGALGAGPSTETGALGAGPSTETRGAPGAAARARPSVSVPGSPDDGAKAVVSSKATIGSDGATFTIEPGNLKRGESVYITTSTGAVSSIGMAIGTHAPPVPCPPPAAR